MAFLNDTFNNREIAAGIWFSIIIIFLLLYKDIREPFGKVVHTFFRKSIIKLIFLMLTYISLIIYCFFYLELWDSTLLKDTIYWTVGIAFIMLMNANDANKDKWYFKKIILDNLKFILILEFIVNFYAFNLIWEIILFPFLLFSILMKVTTENDKEYENVGKMFSGLLNIVGITYFILAIIHVIKQFDSFATYDNLRSFLFAPIMTILYIPFVYIIALHMSYKSFFLRLRFTMKDKSAYYYAKIRILFLCWLNLWKLNAFTRTVSIYKFDTKEETKNTIKEFKVKQKHPIGNIGS